MNQTWTSWKSKAAAGCVCAALIASGSLWAVTRLAFAQSGQDAADGSPTRAAPGQAADPPSVDLTSKQLQFVKVEQAGTHKFSIDRSTIGSIDFDEDTQVQVFTPYQGRIISLFVKLDDRVTAGQALFTIDSVDLRQAESALVQAAGVYDLTTKSLARARKLVPAGGGAQKDLDQAASDQQTAEGNLKAARDALRVYGKDDAEIERVVNERRIDGVLVIKSPSNGVVTARNGSPGLFVQPGGAPAPLTIADLSTKWMVAYFTEADSSIVRIGQEVSVRAVAVPGRTFHGRINAVGESIDPATRRFMVRAEIADPENVLRPGMFVNFTVVTGAAVDAVAVPLGGIVRKGDGVMTAWITTDRRHFTQRIVKIGMQQDGLDEIVDGIRVGEAVVTDGAVFLNNILEAGPSE